MIYQHRFIKELSLTAVGIFVVLLVVLVATQAINLLGRAAGGSVAIDAVAALVGFWTISLTPVLLILTAYISTLTVLTRYWRDSEMAVWLASGLALRRWIKPILQFAVPFAVLVAAVSMWIQPWAELRSREFAEMLKQKQELSLIEPGVFREMGKHHPRIYFIESFDADTGRARNLFVRERSEQWQDTVIFARSGLFKQDKGKRILQLHNGYRYQGTAGHADYERASFKDMALVVSVDTSVISPEENRHTMPMSGLVGSHDPGNQAELMWRLSLPVSVLILSLLALPLSYYNPRTGHTYNILFAIGLFLIYQNGLTFLRDAIQSGKLPFWPGLLSMHLLMFFLFIVLMRWRSRPGESLRNALLSIFGVRAQ